MRLTLRVFEFGQQSSTLGVSMLYVYGAMPAGGALMSLRFAQETWRLLRGEVEAV
jgi:TRAP-type C4-dicarboxylate transport system permease small subunit